MAMNRLVLSVTALACTTLVACDQVRTCACAEAMGPVWVCGTRLFPGGAALSQLDLDAPPPTTPTRPASPVRHSVIPASMTWTAARDQNLGVDLVRTGKGCANDPVIIVDPVTAFRTVAVARGRNGGIAGISLAELSDKVPTTIRAYRRGRLIGQLILNPPTPIVPRPSPEPTTPIVPTGCRKPRRGVMQPMICGGRPSTPKAAN